MFTRVVQSHTKVSNQNYRSRYKVDVTYDSNFKTTNTLTDYIIMQNITNKNKHSNYSSIVNNLMTYSINIETKKNIT